MKLTRGKVVGGTAAINGMIYVRGHPADHDGWKASGLLNWGYDDVLPAFRKLESSWRGASDEHGDGGPVGASAPFRQAFTTLTG